MSEPNWHKKSEALQKALDEIKVNGGDSRQCNCGHFALAAWRTGLPCASIPISQHPIICIDCAQDDINSLIKLEIQNKETSIRCEICKKYINIFVAGFHFFESGCKEQMTEEQQQSYYKQFAEAEAYMQRKSGGLND